MVDAYKVSVALALTDNISAALGLVTTKVLGLDKAVKGVGTNMGEWSNSLKGVGALLGAAGLLGAMVKLVDRSASRCPTTRLPWQHSVGEFISGIIAHGAKMLRLEICGQE